MGRGIWFKCPQIINYNQGAPLNFHLLPSSGQSFSLSVRSVYELGKRISWESLTGYLAQSELNCDLKMKVRYVCHCHAAMVEMFWEMLTDRLSMRMSLHGEHG